MYLKKILEVNTLLPPFEMFKYLCSTYIYYFNIIKLKCLFVWLNALITENIRSI